MARQTVSFALAHTVTNQAGAVVGRMAYDAFGKVFSQSGQSSRYGYTGRPLDGDIGLQYNRARFYDAGVGRWNRMDDYRGEVAVPASLQRYVYVHNAPVNFTDPSGFIAQNDEIREFFITFADLLFGILTTWLEEFFIGKNLSATESVRRLGSKLGIAGIVLFTLVSLALLWSEGGDLLCNALKTAILLFWTTVFFVLSAFLIAIPYVGPVTAFAIIIVGAATFDFIVSRWFRGVELMLDCGC